MRHTVKKTHQLTPGEFLQLADLFKTVFGHAYPVDHFKKKYRSPVTGYSYHGLLLTDSGTIAGATTLIPLPYRHRSADRIFAQSVDTMIHKDFRTDFLALKKIHAVARKLAAEEGVSFIFGKANDFSYPYFKSVIKWKDVGDLHYYVVPVRPEKLLPVLKYVRFLSPVVPAILRKLPAVFSKRKPDRLITEKNTGGEYLKYRFDDTYPVIEEGDRNAFYKIYEEEGIRTACIMECIPCEPAWLRNIFSTIYRIEKKNIDLIVYIGDLGYPFPNAIKVPRRYEPKKVHFSGEIVDPDAVGPEIFDLKNWHVSFSDFDVR
jgi:hypothetical protein